MADVVAITAAPNPAAPDPSGSVLPSPEQDSRPGDDANDSQQQSPVAEEKSADSPKVDATAKNADLKSNSNNTEGGTTAESNDLETATDATDESNEQQQAPQIVVSNSKKSRPPYNFDPSKITLRFLFANRDGLTVTVECKPADTVGEVKGALISVWPDDLPHCDNGDRLRLVCMGKGYLNPDSRTLEDCEVPVFKTHPTPVNVSVRPQDEKNNSNNNSNSRNSKRKADSSSNSNNNNSGGSNSNSNNAMNGTSTTATGQGCGCVIS